MEPEERGREPEGRLGARTPGGSSAPLRIAIALGDPERERALLAVLGESGEFAVTERCLAADQLLACLEDGRVDAALLAFGLHRLSPGALRNLARARVPLVLLAEPSEIEPWQPFSGVVLSPEADADSVRRALFAAIRGESLGQAPQTAIPEVRARAPAEPSGPNPRSPSAIIAIASGHGSPGRTTVAVNLAAALGAVAPTVLVDADVSGPSVAAYLDLDPTRNLYMLAHAEPSTARAWDRAIEQESQPLSPRSPHGVAICGVPKPELRNGISVRLFESLVEELGQRYRYVVVDVGAELLGSEAALHRAALVVAGQVLLVASGDLVGLWHVRSVLGLLKNSLQVGTERVALVLSRHDRRHHHNRAEIEWALGIPAAAVIPYDHGAAQRATARQVPLILDGGRAGRALLDLAERVHGGRVLMPTEPVRDHGTKRWGAETLLQRLRRGPSSTRERGAARG